MTFDPKLPPPVHEKPKMELGCTSLAIIAVIVMIFSQSSSTRGLKDRIEELNAKIDRLEKKIDQLQKAAPAAPATSTAPTTTTTATSAR
jgi:outer membrane murein-binding lipoprotein Lpp